MGSARAALDGGVLTLSTGRITRSFRWNGGHLIGTAIADRETGRHWKLTGDAPDVIVPGTHGAPTGPGRFVVRRIADDGISPAHLLAVSDARVGSLDVRRSCTLFPNAPVIRCTVALRGTAPAGWERGARHDSSMIETARASAPAIRFGTDRLALPGRHWRADMVRFLTATDHHDTLVRHDSILLYREDERLHGNILRLKEGRRDGQIFLLKEAPSGADQLGWPGEDFTARIGDVRVSGSGFEAADLSPNRWTEAYAVVVGVAAPGRLALLDAVRAHHETVRRYDPARDAMLMSNTWGDRSRDSRMNEAFLMHEIDAAAALGLSHVQLDDGWQAGLSRNSASRAGRRWENWSDADWRPHPQRFPRGLAPLIERARTRGVRLGLWFNPSQADDYAAWRRDADILIGYWRRHGIANFKIDGVNVSTKAAERNLRAFFDRVEKATGGAAVFNLDVTAGRRPGYFFLNRYGNIFLENRYTDWGNYYPHRTLRNLWMLSAYVPPQWLQIEFLNVARNPDRYAPGDPLAPASVPFGYVFATTAAAQPLAWMEVSGLAERARALAPLVRAYRAIQPDIHRGRIFPIGAEPDGGAWTGFQSILPEGRTGYLILYREPLAPAEGRLATLLAPGRSVQFEPVLGAGARFTAAPDAAGAIAVKLPAPHGFAIYRYRQD